MDQTCEVTCKVRTCGFPPSDLEEETLLQPRLRANPKLALVWDVNLVCTLSPLPNFTSPHLSYSNGSTCFWLRPLSLCSGGGKGGHRPHMKEKLPTLPGLRS